MACLCKTFYMLYEYELAAYIEGCLPELHTTDNLTANNRHDAYKAITTLADYMKKKCRDDDMAAVKKIMQVAERVYLKGNAMAKNCIENIFVFSISAIMPQDRAARKQLQGIIPTHLFSLYVQQMMHSGN